MAKPIELKFSLNTLPHPGFKVRDGLEMEELIRPVVGLQYLKNDPETPIFADFRQCSTGGSIFH